MAPVVTTPVLVPLFCWEYSYGALRGIDVYACFIEGASDGLKVIVRIAPYNRNVLAVGLCATLEHWASL